MKKTREAQPEEGRLVKSFCSSAGEISRISIKVENWRMAERGWV
jgi:hypothetical protein